MKNWFAVLFVSLSCLISAHGSIDVYIKFEDADNADVNITKGDSQDQTYNGNNGWFVLNGFSLGMQNTVNIGSISTGGGAGKATFDKVEIGKGTGEGSAKLLLACARGNHYDKVTIVVARAGTGSGGPGRIRIMQIELYLTFIESVKSEGAAGDDTMSETVVLAHGAQRTEFFTQTAQGAEQAAGFSEWSVVRNEASTITE